MAAELSDYPNVILAMDYRHMHIVYNNFIIDNIVQKAFKSNDYIEVTANGGINYIIMAYSRYLKWCKGRTYFMNGKKYHSGYEMPGDLVE